MHDCVRLMSLILLLSFGLMEWLRVVDEDDRVTVDLAMTRFFADA